MSPQLSRHLAFQHPASLAQPNDGLSHPVGSGHNARGWWTIAQLAAELHYKSDSGCLRFCKREGIALRRRGRLWLIAVLDVNRALDIVHGSKATRRIA
jgi:hypothetical protein